MPTLTIGEGGIYTVIKNDAPRKLNPVCTGYAAL